MDFIQEIFPWTANLETGLKDIDDQHRVLVGLINRLATHYGNHADRQSLLKVFDELAAYADYHFDYEEQIWKKSFVDDGWLNDHLREHAIFTNSLQMLRRKEQTYPLAEVAEETLRVLTHWLAFHILENDRSMALVLQGLGKGMDLAAAKAAAVDDMSGAAKILIDAILDMYDKLTAQTLEMMREVSARQRAESRLRLAASVFDNAFEAICVITKEGEILEVNPAFTAMTGYEGAEIVGQNLLTLRPMLAEAGEDGIPWALLAEIGHWDGEIKSRAKGGDIQSEWLSLSTVVDTDGGIRNYLCVFYSVARMIERQQTLENAAYFDALTGLPNRILLADRMELALVRAHRNHTGVAICYLDLDGFKPINDRYGHAAGDRVLCEVSQRLKKMLRSNDTIARLGGDEFVVVLDDVRSQSACRDLIDRIVKEVSDPIWLDERTEVAVQVSVGVAIFPQDGTDADLLLTLADKAMYRAKSEGEPQFAADYLSSV